jgi:hypothetical protein
MTVPKRTALVAACLMAFAACRPPSAEGDPGPYFDLHAWLGTEAERLTAEGWGVRKTVTTPEGESAVTIDSADWSREWAAFLSFDLAHPELERRYRVDSVRDAGGYTTVRYRAVDERLHPREVAVWWSGDQVVALSLFDTTANVLYRSGLRVRYEAADGRYAIRARNASRLFRDADYAIRGTAVR